MFQRKLQNEVENLGFKLTKIEEQLNNKKIDGLETQVKDLNKTVFQLKGGMKYIIVAFSVVSIVFAVASGFGLFRIYEYENFKASSDSINKLLVKQIETQTATAINKFNIAKSSKQEERELLELIELIKIIDDLGVDNNKFEGIKELVDVLEKVVFDEDDKNLEEASNRTKKISKIYPTDNFIVSRAETLNVLIEIAKERNRQLPEEMKKSLIEAIKLDSTNAGAFNGLGILLSNEARSKLFNKDFDNALKMTKQATLNYEVASLLNPSSTGKLKNINNKIWCNLILIRGFLVFEGPSSKYIEKLIYNLNYESTEDFFETSRKELEVYETTTDFPIASETIAQLNFVEAEYLRKTNELSERNANIIKRADDLERKGYEKFIEAINKEIYKRVKYEERALKQFNEDFLHLYFIEQKPDLAESIRVIIKETLPEESKSKSISQ